MGIHYPVQSNILLKGGATSSFDGIFPLQDIKSKLPKNMKMSFLSLELKLSQTIPLLTNALVYITLGM